VTNLSGYKRRIMCERKLSHRKFSEAEKHLARLRKDPNGTEPERLHIYACPLAPANDPHWHVGHRTRKVHAKLREMKLL